MVSIPLLELSPSKKILETITSTNMDFVRGIIDFQKPKAKMFLLLFLTFDSLVNKFASFTLLCKNVSFYTELDT